jgi:hypothetical protein
MFTWLIIIDYGCKSFPTFTATHRYTERLADLCSEHQAIQVRLGKVSLVMIALFYPTLLRNTGTQSR